MLNIIFKKQNGPGKNLYLVDPKDQSLVVTALSVSGYVVSPGLDENPWETANSSTLDAVFHANGDMMLLANPQYEDDSSQRAATMVMEALKLYRPNSVGSTYKTLHQPVHYENSGW
jgi:hypothetical protein